MDNILIARSQMAMSLAFHIVFAAIGIAMPVLMAIAGVAWGAYNSSVNGGIVY